MTIGERIKNRREEIGMPQAILAEKCGYKTKSSIAKIESDEVGVPQNKVQLFALALGVSPSWICGFDDQEANARKAEAEDRTEVELLRVFRSLSMRRQTRLLTLAYGLQDEQEAEDEKRK